MFSIGEFSRVTGLTVKTLRFYHEAGVLVPTHVDDETGYRYYALPLVETARIVAQLRELDFPVSEIAEILAGHDDEADILDYLERRKQALQDRLRQDRDRLRSLDRIISTQREAREAMTNATYQVEEKMVDRLLIAGVRMQGPYSACGQGFARIGRKFGRHICGKPFLLHYDTEYKEHDADFEACMPIKKGSPADGIDVRELPAIRCVSLLHKGPWHELGRSYATILQYVQERGYEIEVPTREVYIKGPGMIFKGNPKRYLTEIQLPIGSVSRLPTSQ